MDSIELLTPVRFLDRSAATFAERTAVADGARTFTYAELASRVHSLSRTAYFKARREIHFLSLPRTSTGKIQKNVLRSWTDDDIAAADSHRRVDG